MSVWILLLAWAVVMLPAVLAVTMNTYVGVLGAVVTDTLVHLNNTMNI